MRKPPPASECAGGGLFSRKWMLQQLRCIKSAGKGTQNSLPNQKARRVRHF